jgi:16S rRNA (guanine(966)-N(2))-methyltransferase RsmD
VRVIGGIAGSVPLYEVKAQTTRSMTDRVKTSVFSILDPLLDDAEVLDLYAGTGGLGIEALSRGARFCTFVDRDRTCARTIARNLDRTKLADRGRIIERDARAAVTQLAAEDLRVDLVLFDPPLDLGKPPRRSALEKLIASVAERLLASDGLIVYHHEQDTAGGLFATGLEPADQRNYGRNIVTFLRHKT